MTALIQRVNKASVKIDGKLVGQIDKGLCILLGINNIDNELDIDFLTRKIDSLKFFSANGDKFSKTVKDIAGEILVVSQFTLYANLRKGTKPSFTNSMQPNKAKTLYDLFCSSLKKQGYRIQTGEFGAYMQVNIENDGPVTLNLNSDHLSHHV